MLAWRWQYVAEYIEREALLREMLNSGRAAYLVVMDAPAVTLKSLRPTWRDPDKDPPKVETEVLILYRNEIDGYGITTAHYEDGNVFYKIANGIGRIFPIGGHTTRSRTTIESQKAGGNTATLPRRMRWNAR